MMFRIHSLLLIQLVFICLASSCAQKESVQAPHSSNRGTIVIESIPFVKQKDKFCGPASMASVMQFYGQNIDQDEIAQEIYIPELNGALISDMENFAIDNGYGTQTTNGSIKLLKSQIDNGLPVILLVDKGKWKVSSPHYYVAYGYSQENKTVLVHTGYKSGQEIGFDTLDSEWEKMNRLMLVIQK